MTALITNYPITALFTHQQWDHILKSFFYFLPALVFRTSLSPGGGLNRSHNSRRMLLFVFCIITMTALITHQQKDPSGKVLVKQVAIRSIYDSELGICILRCWPDSHAVMLSLFAHVAHYSARLVQEEDKHLEEGRESHEPNLENEERNKSIKPRGKKELRIWFLVPGTGVFYQNISIEYYRYYRAVYKNHAL